jgi:putative transposase
MPSKYYQRNFQKNYYYHLFNRGAHKQNIFLDKQDYETFLEVLSYYLKFPQGTAPSRLSLKQKLKVPNLQSPTYQLSCYCLMPNHFHLLIKQVKEPQPNNNISSLLRRYIIAYCMYFNKKYDHSGSVFQGKYKNTMPKTDEQLLHLTKYIHRNPEGSKPSDYPYSSYKYYLNQNPPNWLHIKEILSFFSKTNTSKDYKNFVEEINTTTEIISNLILE